MFQVDYIMKPIGQEIDFIESFNSSLWRRASYDALIVNICCILFLSFTPKAAYC